VLAPDSGVGRGVAVARWCIYIHEITKIYNFFVFIRFWDGFYSARACGIHMKWIDCNHMIVHDSLVFTRCLEGFCNVRALGIHME